MAKRAYVYNGTQWVEISSASAVPAASTSGEGVVQLTDSTSSTSTTTAATPNSVKMAYDLANAAIPKSTVTTAGDILYATGNATVARLGIGQMGQVLTRTGTTGAPGTGLEWSYNPPRIQNDQGTATTYTLQLTDAGKYITFASGSATTVTVPTYTSIDFPIGTTIDIIQHGTGQVTISAPSASVLSNGTKMKLSGQYAVATLLKYTTDGWYLFGNLSA